MSEQKETKAGRLIITTVGTSALNGDKLDRLYLVSAWQDLQKSLRAMTANQQRVWIEREPPKKIADFRDAYVKQIAECVIDKEKDKPKQGGTNVFSAELTSLYVMKLKADEDRIILFLSDSPEGVLSGLLVQSLLREMFSLTPEMRIVEGLQVENFGQFFERGRQEFASAVTGYVNAFPDLTHVLNVTGGFKSLIPFATYAALAHSMKLYFSFEEQPEPIVIDPTQWPVKVQEKAKPLQHVLQQDLVGLLSPPIVAPL